MLTVKNMNRTLSITLCLALVFAFAAMQATAQSGRKAPEPKDAGQQEKKEDPPQADADKPRSGKEVTKRAVILAKPNPDYPRQARRSRVAGRVVLRIVLSADGRVGDKIEVIEGLPEGVTEAAMAAARKIQFIPAERDGRPVSQYVTVVYNFNLY